MGVSISGRPLSDSPAASNMHGRPSLIPAPYYSQLSSCKGRIPQAQEMPLPLCPLLSPTITPAGGTRERGSAAGGCKASSPNPKKTRFSAENSSAGVAPAPAMPQKEWQVSGREARQFSAPSALYALSLLPPRSAPQPPPRSTRPPSTSPRVLSPRRNHFR